MTGINTQATGLKTFAELYGTGYQPTGAPLSTPTLQNNPPQAPVPNLAQDGQNPLEKSPKSDTITIAGKTINKKTAIKAGLGALAAVAVVGISIFAFRGRGRTPNVQPPVAPPLLPAGREDIPIDPAKLADELQTSANEMLQRANELVETAQKKIDAVTNLIKNNGKDTDGKVVAKIDEDIMLGDDVQQWIETAEDGTVTRTSTFIKGVLRSITEHLGDGKENVIKLDDGKLHSCSEGIEALEDGGERIARKILIKSGGMDLYSEGIEKTGVVNTPERVVATAKKLELFNGKPTKYNENMRLETSTVKTGRVLIFDESGLPKILTLDKDGIIGTNFSKLPDGTWEAVVEQE